MTSLGYNLTTPKTGTPTAATHAERMLPGLSLNGPRQKVWVEASAEVYQDH